MKFIIMDLKNPNIESDHVTEVNAEVFEQFCEAVTTPKAPPLQQTDTQQFMSTINALLTQNAVLIQQLTNKNQQGESKVCLTTIFCQI